MLLGGADYYVAGYLIILMTWEVEHVRGEAGEVARATEGSRDGLLSDFRAPTWGRRQRLDDDGITAGRAAGSWPASETTATSRARAAVQGIGDCRAVLRGGLGQA